MEGVTCPLPPSSTAGKMGERLPGPSPRTTYVIYFTHRIPIKIFAGQLRYYKIYLSYKLYTNINNYYTVYGTFTVFVLKHCH